MSIRAYRVNEIVTEKSNSFNLWHDKDLMEFLEKESHFWANLNEDGCGLSEVSVEVLERAIRELNLNPETVKSLEEDIRWAEINKEEYIQYYCY